MKPGDSTHRGGSSPASGPGAGSGGSRLDTGPSSGLSARERTLLRRLLADAQTRGFIGPGPAPASLSSRADRSPTRRRAVDVPVQASRHTVDAHLEHSIGFAATLPGLVTQPVRDGHGLAVDLGTGGGVPGLILASLWTLSRWLLLDGSVTRTNWLRSAVAELALDHRIEVMTARAEDAGRGRLRGQGALVVARGFGGPAVTAECAAPLLRIGGHLAVTEPPGGRPHRWPASGLEVLGLALIEIRATPVSVALLQQVTACPDRFPRRTGVPTKRPLF